MAASAALVGLPGSGKSAIGRKLAHRLGVPFVDSDDVIESRIGCSIREYFEHQGETRFRDVEQEVLAGLTASFGGVIATGGGAVLREANRQCLRAHCHVVYLRATPEDLFRRLRHDTKRPLLQVDDPLGKLADLHNARHPFYSETAHFVVDSGSMNVSAVVTAIVTRSAVTRMMGT